MKRLFSVSEKRGLPPGSMVYTGRLVDEPQRVTVIDYTADEFSELTDVDVEACAVLRDSPSVSWINVDGLNDTATIGRLGELFGLHPLVLEDILHTNQRPKLEDQGDYLFLVARMLYHTPGEKEVQSEQISFVLTEHCLITFQERPGDVFEIIRDRIRQDHGRIRKMGVDYVLYALMDAIVDNYFLIMETTGETIESIEEALLKSPDSSLLNELYEQKRELLYIRKSVWPLREAVGGLERGESPLLKKKTHAYLRDLYDHTIQVIDTVETFRDMLSGVQDLYLSSLGHKTNQVMQLLTIIATIFIPITFIAGVYGMNFDAMPELHWKYGYATVWAIMLLVGGGMGVYFRKMKWL